MLTSYTVFKEEQCDGLYCRKDSLLASRTSVKMMLRDALVATAERAFYPPDQPQRVPCLLPSAHLSTAIQPADRLRHRSQGARSNLMRLVPPPSRLFRVDVTSVHYHATMAEDINRLLQATRDGDARAADLLMPLVYEQLRTLAGHYMRAERLDHTLRPTAIVHDAYLKLVQSNMQYTDRLHFYAVAARAMRQILTDWARTSHREKRGGGALRVDLEEHHAIDRAAPEVMLDVDRLLTRLRTFDKRKADVVELIFFGGMTYDEVASLLGLSSVSVHRDLRMAKAWMHAELTGGNILGAS